MQLSQLLDAQIRIWLLLLELLPARQRLKPRVSQAGPAQPRRSNQSHLVAPFVLSLQRFPNAAWGRVAIPLGMVSG